MEGILEEFIPSIVSKVLWVIVLMMALKRLGVDIGPMIAKNKPVLSTNAFHNHDNQQNSLTLCPFCIFICWTLALSYLKPSLSLSAKRLS